MRRQRIWEEATKRQEIEAERGRLLAVNAYLFLADAPTIGEKRAAYRNSLRDLPPSTNKAKDGEWSEKLEES